MSSDEFNKAFDDLEHDLRRKLAIELTVSSGLRFHEDKKDGKVKPVEQKEARLMQFGSSSLNSGPKPFYDRAVGNFAKKNGIKTA